MNVHFLSFVSVAVDFDANTHPEDDQKQHSQHDQYRDEKYPAIQGGRPRWGSFGGGGQSVVTATIQHGTDECRCDGWV